MPQGFRYKHLLVTYNEILQILLRKQRPMKTESCKEDIPEFLPVLHLQQATDFAETSLPTFSAWERSKRPFRKARRVNSPGREKHQHNSTCDSLSLPHSKYLHA
jgi:hypothetical protein